jgi:putative exporter of polyketide antibiotics
MSNFGKTIKNSAEGLNWLLVVGFLGIVWLMIYGNLQGNLGFTAGSQGDNDTNDVIQNMTSGTRTYYGFMPTLFTIMAIVLLITILLALLSVVMHIVHTGKGKSEGYGGE